MNAADVIRQIKDAWGKVPYPGDGDIFTRDSYDDEEITNYFSGTTWRGHKPADLRAHSSAFAFFAPAAFHFWLPAFMIAAIEDPEEADVIIDHIPASLSGCSASERWSLFSTPQREAVAAYLRFQIERFSDGVEAERKALRVLEGPG